MNRADFCLDHRFLGGTLYAILLRLEEDGLITSSWRPGAGGPGRKFYTTTDGGQAALRSHRDTWAAFVATTSELLTAAEIGTS